LIHYNLIEIVRTYNINNFKSLPQHHSIANNKIYTTAKKIKNGAFLTNKKIKKYSKLE